MTSLIVSLLLMYGGLIALVLLVSFGLVLLLALRTLLSGKDPHRSRR